jgi:glucokinase
VSPSALGVDVGGTSTRIVTIDASGAAVRTAVSPTPRGPEPVVDHVAALAGEALAATRDGPVDMIAVGMPGRVDVERGTVAGALNLGIEAPLPIAALLEARLRIPVLLENDVNAAAVGAFATLGLDSGASLAFVSIGTGLATGHVVDGRLHRGATGGAGELGHVPVPGADVPCPCGQAGCLEAVASGGGMVRLWAASGNAAGSRGEPNGVDGADVRALWDAADAGDTTAARIRDGAVAALAWAVQLTVMLLDVDAVVLGGGVSRLGDRLLAPITEELATLERRSPLIRSAAPSRRLWLAPDGVELGAIGVVRAARARTAAGGPDGP